MTMILGKRPTGGIVIDGLVMAIDPSNSMCYRPGVSLTTVRDLSGKRANATTAGTNFVTTAGGGFYLSSNSTNVTSITGALQLNTDFSMGIWINMNTVSPANQYVFRILPDAGGREVGFTVEYNRMMAEVFNTAASQVERTYSDVFTASTYQYFVMTRNLSTLTIYRNGVSTSSVGAGISASVTGVSSYYILGSANGTNPDGYVYMAHIYNKRLSAAEVSQNFNATRARFGV